jgi:aryl-alcohol dehydrogenase-like predicted oxidoreductase
MRSRPLGQTGLSVSELSLGTWAFGGDEWGPSDDAQAIASIRAAIDAGVTLVDTADVYGYGHSEEVLSAALAGRDSAVRVCSKAGNDIYTTPRQAGGGSKSFSAAYLERAVEGSLVRLARDTIDLYLLHNPSQAVLEADEAMGALRVARDAGKVRLIGASVYTAAEGRAAIDVGGADVVMVTYNLINHDEAQELAGYAGDRGVGVLARSPLATGLLTGKYSAASVFPDDDHRAHRGDAWLRSGIAKVDAFRPLAAAHDCSLTELALAYVLSDWRVASVVVGVRSPEQLAANISAAALAPLDEGDQALIAGIAAGW